MPVLVDNLGSDCGNTALTALYAAWGFGGLRRRWAQSGRESHVLRCDRVPKTGKGREAQEKEKPAKAKKPKEDKPEKEGKKKFELNRDMIPDLLKLALDTLSRFRRKITVNRFVLHIIVGGDDPYDAVMSYGMINYAVATVGSAAERAFNVKKSDVQTGLDFSNPHYTVEAGMTVTINLARILAVVAVAGIGFLKIKRRSDKAAKAASQERKEKDGQDADTNG